MSGDRHPEKRQYGGSNQARQQRIARGAQHRRAIGKDISDIDVRWALLRQARERRQDKLLRLALDDFDRWRSREALLRSETREDWRLEDAEPDIKSDCDHDDAEEERDTPAPGQKLVAGNLAEEQYRQVCQREPARSTELRPGGDETTVCVGSRPLHRQQYRAAPLAAHTDALNEAQQEHDDRAPDSDL